MSNMPDSLQLEEAKDEIDVLKQGVYRLRMKKDILEKSAELVKQDWGLNPKHFSKKYERLIPQKSLII